MEEQLKAIDIKPCLSVMMLENSTVSVRNAFAKGCPVGARCASVKCFQNKYANCVNDGECSMYFRQL